MNLPLANLLGPENLLAIAVVGLLLFGKRLPEVGRSLGKGIVEFKKGLAGIEEEVTHPGRQLTSVGNDRAALPPASGGFKFDPYTGQPVPEQDDAGQGV